MRYRRRCDLLRTVRRSLQKRRAIVGGANSQKINCRKNSGPGRVSHGVCVSHTHIILRTRV